MARLLVMFLLEAFSVASKIISGLGNLFSGAVANMKIT